MFLCVCAEVSRIEKAKRISRLVNVKYLIILALFVLYLLDVALINVTIVDGSSTGLTNRCTVKKQRVALSPPVLTIIRFRCCIFAKPVQRYTKILKPTNSCIKIDANKTIKTLTDNILLYMSTTAS